MILVQVLLLFFLAKWLLVSEVVVVAESQDDYEEFGEEIEAKVLIRHRYLLLLIQILRRPLRVMVVEFSLANLYEIEKVKVVVAVAVAMSMNCFLESITFLLFLSGFFFVFFSCKITLHRFCVSKKKKNFFHLKKKG